MITDEFEKMNVYLKDRFSEWVNTDSYSEETSYKIRLPEGILYWLHDPKKVRSDEERFQLLSMSAAEFTANYLKKKGIDMRGKKFDIKFWGDPCLNPPAIYVILTIYEY